MGTWTEPPWLNFLLQAGVIILAVSLIYVIIAYASTEKTIFKTVPASGVIPDDVIGTYHLPTSLVKITAAAKATIKTKKDDGELIAATLTELSINAVAEIIPDTSQLLVVSYTKSSFGNDEVKLAVNADGLLDNASSVTDDRFTNIVTALLEAPVSVFEKTTPASIKHIAAPAAEAIAEPVTEIKEYKKEFIISPDKLTVGNSVSFSWEINIPGDENIKDTLDASFKVILNSPFPGTTSPVTIPVKNDGAKGIYVRPKKILQLSFEPDKENKLELIAANAATITVPDISTAILIPVTRAVMVKKTQGLKFQQGMLLENAVTKPSEAEAIVKIPLNILKAIFAVPGQLLSFRINRVQQEKSFVTEDAALSKAKLDSDKARIGTDAELAKARLDAQKIITSYEQDILKAKLDTQKALVEAEKARVGAETDLTKAKLEAQKTANAYEHELLKAKTDTQKAITEAEKNNIAAQKDLIKAQQDLLQSQKDLEDLRKKLKPAGN